MSKRKPKPLPPTVEELLARKATVLSKAQAFSDMGLRETALPLWTTAAGYEERLAPLLEGLGHEQEAAVHRISAASCYEKGGDLTRAANLYRAALAGPLLDGTRKDVMHMLRVCLEQLTRSFQAAGGLASPEDFPAKT